MKAGYCSIGRSGLPWSWLIASLCRCAAFCASVCAVTSANARVVDVDLRARPAGDQRLLALQVALLDLDVLLASSASRVSDCRLDFRIAKSVRTLASLALACWRAKPERLRVDLEQLVAGLDALALAHQHARDLAGDVGRDQHLGAPDIGVVGGDVAAAAEIHRKPDRRKQQRQNDQENDAQRSPRDARERAGAGADARRVGNELERRLSHSASASRPTAFCSIACLRLSRACPSFESTRSISADSMPASTVADSSSSCTAMRSSSGRAAGVRYSRLARRSFGSARRSIRPLSHSRSTSRVSVIGWRSSCFGEVGLLETLAPLEPQQHRPLRPGHAEPPRLLVGVGPQQAADVADGEQDFAALAALGHGGLFPMRRYYKQAYYIGKRLRRGRSAARDDGRAGVGHSSPAFATCSAGGVEWKSGSSVSATWAAR